MPSTHDQRQPSGAAQHGAAGTQDQVAGLSLDPWLFQHALEEVPAAIAILQGPDLVFVLANASFRRAVGRDDLLGKPLYEALPREITAGTESIFRRVRERGQAVHGHEVAVRLGDRLAHYNFVCAPLRRPDGQVDGVLVHGIEVTEHVLARQRAEQTEQWLRAVVEQLPAGVVIAERASGEVVLSNARAVALLGDQPLRITAPPPSPTPPEAEIPVRARVAELLGRAVEQGTSILAERLRYEPGPNGARWLTALVAPVRDQTGVIMAAVAIFRDVTEQRRAEFQLRQLAAASLAINSATSTPERLRLITEHARAIVGAHQAVASLTRGPDWSQAITAVSLSDKYAAWRDYDAPTDGSGIYAEVCRTNRVFRLTQAELERHPLWRGFGREAGRHPPLRGWLAVPLVGRDGRNLGLIQLSDKYEGDFTEQDEAVLVQLAQLAAVALDNMALYEAEQAARAEAEAAVRARDEFLSIAAHELKTPVTGLKGTVQLLLRRQARGTLDATHLPKALTLLDQATERLAALLNDLLDVSRIRMGRLPLSLGRVDMRELLETTLRHYQEQGEASSRIHLALASPLPPLYADAARLEQVLVNLLDNALKYSPPGTPVRVVVREADGGLLVRVEDQGIGLTPGSEHLIFEPFGRAPNAARSHLPGMGLGLYICRNIIERHGGRIWAESAGEDAGAAFVFWLPVTSPALATGDAAS